jgi:hypothetical protein
LADLPTLFLSAVVCITLTGRMTENDEVKRMQMGEVMAYSNILFHNLPKGTKKK